MLRIAVLFFALPALGAGPYAVIDGPKGRIQAPLFSRSRASLPVAQVGARTVTLADLAAAIAASHEDRRAAAKGKKDFTPVLDRLIGVRLLVQEAEAMGLDELEPLQRELRAYKDVALREQLQAIAVRRARADAKEVRRLYREATRHSTIRSAIFAKEEDAKAVVKEPAAAFDGLIRKAVAAKTALGGEVQTLSPKAGVLPPIVEAVRPLSPGQVAGPIRVPQGYVVLRVQSVEHRPDPAARREAQERALASAKARKLTRYYARLIARYGRIDRALVDALDFEAKEPGLAALAKDPRPVATIEGEEAITVAELAAELRRAFFHSMERAIASKRVNDRKREALDSLLSKRLVALQVARLKLAESPAHRQAMALRRDQLLFSMFVQRAVLPEVKVTDAELLRYYDEHKAELTFPAFYALHSLSFETQRAAQAAFDQLKGGADFKWVKANADGQVPLQRRAFDLDGAPLSTRGLTPDVAAALAGAQSGDLRLMEKGGQHFVLFVRQVTPASVQPFEKAREALVPKVRDELVNKVMQEWVARLRKAHAVKVFITRITS